MYMINIYLGYMGFIFFIGKPLSMLRYLSEPVYQSYGSILKREQLAGLRKGSYSLGEELDFELDLEG